MINKREYTKTELGLVFGMTIGAVIASIMFALTNDPLWFSAIGVGLALGLGIGASLDKKTS